MQKVMLDDRISIKLMDENKNPVEKILLKIELFSEIKNNYFIILPPSNNAGIIDVSIKYLKDSVDADRNFFLMDYPVPFESLHGDCNLSLMSVEKISNALKGFYEFKDFTSFPENYENWLNTCKNHLYEPSTMETDIEKMIKGIEFVCKRKQA